MDQSLSPVLLKSLVIWVLIVPLAMLNGLVREFALVPALGRPAALPLSGLLLAALVLGLTWTALPRLGALPAAHYWTIGALWLALTVGFEFGLGRAMGKGWPELLAAYDVRTGNLWPAVLLVVGLAPALVAHLRGLAR